MRRRFSVWQHLVVDAVVESGTTLSVQLRDRAGRRNSVTYQFRDRIERLRQRDILDGWRTTMTSLTYVRAGTQGTLLDDEAAFWQAFG